MNRKFDYKGMSRSLLALGVILSIIAPMFGWMVLVGACRRACAEFGVISGRNCPPCNGPVRIRTGALLGVRGLSAGNVVGTRLARLPLSVAIAPDPAASTPCPNARPWSAAPDLRSGSTVAGILLTNHALLL